MLYTHCARCISCMHEKLGGSPVSSTFSAANQHAPHRSMHWSKQSASSRQSVSWDWAGRIQGPPKFEIRTILSAHMSQPVRKSTKEG